jgi:hypothetical protein
MARKTKVITVTLKVEVDLKAYAAEYLLPEDEVIADINQHIPYVVEDATRVAFERLGYATLTRKS